ncbi:hypothetical protein [Staphylospora marina]|uniref:hypothetical protein n=1 Tax=Staphylospora marina TaxID=2490858 RepID=UPI000F5BD17B|nr:hypothetical protein [Staphylospora marina]
MAEKVTSEMIYELLINMSARLERIEKKVNSIEEHVANIDERLTQVEKVRKLFDPEVLEKIG